MDTYGSFRVKNILLGYLEFLFLTGSKVLLDEFDYKNQMRIYECFYIVVKMNFNDVIIRE